MGDRVWANIKIGGHLDTIEEAEELIDAMTSDGLAEDDEDGQTRLRAAIENDEPFEHEEDEVNYGTFREVEANVTGNPKLSSITVFGRGGGFDSGSRTIHEGVETSFTGEGGLVDSDSVRKAIITGGAEAVVELLDRMNFLETKCVTKLTASPAVAAWLKIFGEKAA